LAKFADLNQTVSEFLINRLQVTCQTYTNTEKLLIIVIKQTLITR